MRAACDGNTEAFGQLYRKYLPTVVSFLCRSGALRSAAEDLAQEVFLRAWQQRNRYRRSASVRTYLFAIATNVTREASRQKRLPALPLDKQLAILTAVSRQNLGAEVAELDELREVIEAAKAKLPAPQRLTVELVHTCGLPPREVARRLKCTPRQLAGRLYRARSKLRRLVTQVPKRATRR
jgi:RNA polymerase sigma-70 factor (ECF subfamily)